MLSLFVLQMIYIVETFNERVSGYVNLLSIILAVKSTHMSY